MHARIGAASPYRGHGTVQQNLKCMFELTLHSGHAILSRKPVEAAALIGNSERHDPVGRCGLCRPGRIELPLVHPARQGRFDDIGLGEFLHTDDLGRICIH